ncbi:putative defense protein 3 [Oratosquilla oratoria]|uniref:putative defense protein 3 n=1 Tax=Oratosquilla oratoria TaxID=337810 RepID=UPI003F75AD08
MARQMTVLTVVTVVAMYIGWSEAYSSGDIEAACDTLLPVHGVEPQGGESPFSITLSNTIVSSQGHINVTISGHPFKGVIIRPTAFGFFVAQNGFRTLSCSSTNDTFAHSDNTVKTNPVTFRWNAQDNPIGTYIFNATIVKSKGVFFTNNTATFEIQ